MTNTNIRKLRLHESWLLSFFPRTPLLQGPKSIDERTVTVVTRGNSLVLFIWRVQIQLPLLPHLSQSLAWHCLSKQSLDDTTRCWRSVQFGMLQSAFRGTHRLEQPPHHWHDYISPQNTLVLTDEFTVWQVHHQTVATEMRKRRAATYGVKRAKWSTKLQKHARISTKHLTDENWRKWNTSFGELRTLRCCDQRVHVTKTSTPPTFSNTG